MTPKTEELFLKLQNMGERGFQISLEDMGSYSEMELLACKMLFIIWELEGSGYWTTI